MKEMEFSARLEHFCGPPEILPAMSQLLPLLTRRDPDAAKRYLHIDAARASQFNFRRCREPTVAQLVALFRDNAAAAEERIAALGLHEKLQSSCLHMHYAATDS